MVIGAATVSLLQLARLAALIDHQLRLLGVDDPIARQTHLGVLAEFADHVPPGVGGEHLDHEMGDTGVSYVLLGLVEDDDVGAELVCPWFPAPRLTHAHSGGQDGLDEIGQAPAHVLVETGGERAHHQLAIDVLPRTSDSASYSPHDIAIRSPPRSVSRIRVSMIRALTVPPPPHLPPPLSVRIGPCVLKQIQGLPEQHRVRNAGRAHAKWER